MLSSPRLVERLVLLLTVAAFSAAGALRPRGACPEGEEQAAGLRLLFATRRVRFQDRRLRLQQEAAARVVVRVNVLQGVRTRLMGVGRETERRVGVQHAHCGRAERLYQVDVELKRWAAQAAPPLASLHPQDLICEAATVRVVRFRTAAVVAVAAIMVAAAALQFPVEAAALRIRQRIAFPG